MGSWMTKWYSINAAFDGKQVVKISWNSDSRYLAFSLLLIGPSSSTLSYAHQMCSNLVLQTVLTKKMFFISKQTSFLAYQIP